MIVAKRKPKPVADGRTFDSLDEVEFYWWCVEAREFGLLESFRCQSPCFTLSHAVTVEQERFGKTGNPIASRQKTLLREATYTADFQLSFSVPDMAADCGFHDVNDQPFLVDVKPAFDRDQSRERKFSVLQKWVYQCEGAYVHPVVPVEFFAKMWCPEKARFTPTGKVRNSARYNDLPTLKNWLQKIANKCEKMHSAELNKLP